MNVLKSKKLKILRLVYFHTIEKVDQHPRSWGGCYGFWGGLFLVCRQPPSLCPRHLLLACAPAWGQRETETPLSGDVDSRGPGSPPVTSFRLCNLLKQLSSKAVTLGVRASAQGRWGQVQSPGVGGTEEECRPRSRRDAERGGENTGLVGSERGHCT